MILLGNIMFYVSEEIIIKFLLLILHEIPNSIYYKVIICINVIEELSRIYIFKLVFLLYLPELFNYLICYDSIIYQLTFFFFKIQYFYNKNRNNSFSFVKSPKLLDYTVKLNIVVMK